MAETPTRSNVSPYKASRGFPASHNQRRRNTKMDKIFTSSIVLDRRTKTYMLATSIVFMVLTTSLRLTLNLTNHMDAQNDSLSASLPHDLVHHLHQLDPLTKENGSTFTRTKSRRASKTSADGRTKATTTSRLVDPADTIYDYRPKHWDSAPVVIEEYKLLFFTVPKVACTTFKQLFRRMMGHQDWKSQDFEKMLPHNPKTNGLRYLWNYSLAEANHMMTSPEYTRAIFVRDPKSRFLSAFLDKAVSNYGKFIQDKCCPNTKDCVSKGQTSKGFLQLIRKCSDPHWDPQGFRMEPKYWEFINFVGHFETLHKDGPALLQRIGAWDKYGTDGWGKDGNSSIFQRATDTGQSHSTGSSQKVWQWLYPSLERQVEAYYAADYVHPLFHFPMTNLTKDFWLRRNHKIYAPGPWDGAPIVVKKYKLIFFTIPQIGASTWKRAFRRMEGFSDWKTEGGPQLLPHDPSQNGLQYLYDYSVDQAEAMIQDPTWTKAIFVRNPKDRFLDLFTFASLHPQEVTQHCCRPGVADQGCEAQTRSLVLLLDLVRKCPLNPYWEPQTDRMESKFWPYITFVGYYEQMQDDARRLLQQIGAWETIGASGWGESGDQPMFQEEISHKVDPVLSAMGSYSPEVDRFLDSLYVKDFTNDRFHFAKKPTPLLPTIVVS